MPNAQPGCHQWIFFFFEAMIQSIIIFNWFILLFFCSFDFAVKCTANVLFPMIVLITDYCCLCLYLIFFFYTFVSKYIFSSFVCKCAFHFVKRIELAGV